MKEIKHTREQLETRRDEINKQLNRVNDQQRIELDNDMEEQAIEVEHTEVAVSMEENLRKELNAIEEKLIEIDKG